MVIIATRNIESALRMHAFVEGRRAFAFTVENLIELTKTYYPSVVVLNTRFGMQHERAIERIPQLLRLAPSCSIVVITYSPSETEIQELIDLGAYGYVDADRPGSFLRAGEIIACARRQARLGRADCLHGRVKAASLH